jgi:hypothetical protein
MPKAIQKCLSGCLSTQNLSKTAHAMEWLTNEKKMNSWGRIRLEQRNNSIESAVNVRQSTMTNSVSISLKNQRLF